MRAVTLWGAAERLYEHTGIDDHPIHDRIRARCEPPALADAPNRASWDAAWKAGSQLVIEDALALAAGWRDDEQNAPEQAGSLAASLACRSGRSTASLRSFTNAVLKSLLSAWTSSSRLAMSPP
jgi:hypothetical protein